MEDENGIELSLGLSWSGSSGKLKAKVGSSSDFKIEKTFNNNNNKLVGDLKNFLHKGIQKQDSEIGSQRSYLVKPQENFFTNLAQTSSDANASMDLHGYGGSWAENVFQSAEVEEEKSDHHEIDGHLWSKVDNKRKMLFDEINHQKKHEREVQNVDFYGKSTSMGIVTSVKTLHISVASEDGLTAENEDVAESEVEGSPSTLVSRHDDGTRRYISGGCSSEVPKESQLGFANLGAKEQKQSNMNIPIGNESKLGSLTNGIPFTLQPHPVMATSYSSPLKMPISAPSTSGYSPPCVMHLMPPSNSEQPGSQSVNPGSLPQTLGHSPIQQLPTLATDHSWAMLSHPQQLSSSYAGRSNDNVAPNSDKSEDGSKISQVVVQAPPHSSIERLP